MTFLETDPPIWRRLLVPGDTTLARLDDVLQAAMEWTGAHLHLFRFGKGDAELRYGPPSPEWDFEVYNEHRPRLHHLARQATHASSTKYDLGDAWEHLVEVERSSLPPTGSRPRRAWAAPCYRCPAS